MAIQAHLLTGLRLALALPLAVAFARPDSLSGGLVALLLAVAIASDYLDGILARRYGTASDAGQLFDHGTDCLFVTAGLTGAALAGRVPLLLPGLIVVAFSQYVIDSYWVHRRKQLRMSTIGRWNGIGYFVPLVVLATARLEVVPTLTPLLTALARVVAYALVASTLVSIIDRATAGRRPLGDRQQHSATTGSGGNRRPAQPLLPYREDVRARLEDETNSMDRTKGQSRRGKP